MSEQETYDEPSSIRLSHERPANPPLVQEWPERPPILSEYERREQAQAHRGEVVEDSGVPLIRHRQTPTERKAYALEQAVQYARSALETIEMSLDELSIDSAPISQEEGDKVVPVIASYLERIERRSRATTG